MVHTPNTKPFLKKIMPLLKKMNDLETEKNNYQISILEQELSKKEIKTIVDRQIYKEPLDCGDYLCNKIYFNKTNEAPCPITEKCEEITKMMGNDYMPCEVLYLKLEKENEL